MPASKNPNPWESWGAADTEDKANNSAHTEKSNDADVIEAEVVEAAEYVYTSNLADESEFVEVGEFVEAEEPAMHTSSRWENEPSLIDEVVNETAPIDEIVNERADNSSAHSFSRQESVIDGDQLNEEQNEEQNNEFHSSHYADQHEADAEYQFIQDDSLVEADILTEKTNDADDIDIDVEAAIEGSAVVNEDVIEAEPLANGATKNKRKPFKAPAFLNKIKDSFLDKKEQYVSVLFIAQGVYRWYLYEVAAGRLEAVEEPVITFTLLVWSDNFNYINHDGNKRAVVKELVRERSIVVKDVKKQGGNWYFYHEDFIEEMRQMGFSKLYSLQMAADALMDGQKLEVVKMLYMAEQDVFAARIISHEEQVIEQTLFNSEDYAIKTIFTNLVTSHKVIADQQHIMEVTLKQLADKAMLQAHWLLEERFLSLPILPVNLSLMAFIGVAAFGVVLLQGAQAVNSGLHQSQMNKKQTELQQLQARFDELHELKSAQIPVNLSLDMQRFIHNARTIYQQGLKVEGSTDYLGRESFTIWWLNGKTPLTSFINTSSIDNCDTQTKVAGNGEMAYKEISCVHPTNYPGRFNTR